MKEQQIPNLGETDEREAELPLINDIHHLTFITADMDRLITFYERVFEARVTVDLQEEGLRHAFIEVGPHTVLHPFQVPGVEPPGKQPFFQRGRLDHFALNAASEEAFRELRRRIVAEGASDSVVTDMGSMLLFRLPRATRSQVRSLPSGNRRARGRVGRLNGAVLRDRAVALRPPYVPSIEKRRRCFC